MRELTIIADAIKRFELDLSGLRVFTEAASGHFAWTASMALLAGAERVYAIARTNAYASAEESARQTRHCAALAGAEERLEVVPDYQALRHCDILTNTGSVRPINRKVLALAKEGLVIPLMWETWEFRDSDLDLSCCAEREILVLGTNEMHPGLCIFNYVGMLGCKLLFETDVELFQSRVLVAGGGRFGEACVTSLAAIGAIPALVCSAEDNSEKLQRYRVGESLADSGAREFLQSADALLFAEHRKQNLLLGEGGELSFADLQQINADLRIAHISGWIAVEELDEIGFVCRPQRLARAPRVMSVTTDYVGPRPILELHVAGLKVAEVMRRARRIYPNDLRKTRAAALQHPLCHDFSPMQIERYGLYR